jgi:hypothetical protein
MTQAVVIGGKEMPLGFVSGMLYSAFDELYWNEGRDFWLEEIFPEYAIAFSSKEGLMRFPYSIVEGKVQLGEGQPVTDVDYVVGGGKKSVLIKKTKTGQVRWMTVSSDVLPDLEGESLSEKALRGAIEFAQKNKAYGELRIAHHPGSRVGMCDTQMFYNGKLVEAGFFDDTERAAKCVEALVADTEGTYKISIGFLYDDTKFVDKVYTDGVVIHERSITSFPCNVRTAIGVSLPGFTEGEVKTMSDSRTHAELVALVGKDEADKIFNSGMGGIKTVMKIKHKEQEGDVEKDGEKAQEVGQDTPGEGTQNPDVQKTEEVKTDPPVQEEFKTSDVIEITYGTKVYRARVLEDDGTDPEVESRDAQIKTLTEENSRLKTAMQERDKELLPRITKFRATKSDATVEKTEKGETPDPVQPIRVSARKFWEEMPGGQPKPVVNTGLEVRD